MHKTRMKELCDSNKCENEGFKSFTVEHKRILFHLFCFFAHGIHKYFLFSQTLSNIGVRENTQEDLSYHTVFA